MNSFILKVVPESSGQRIPTAQNKIEDAQTCIQKDVESTTAI